MPATVKSLEERIDEMAEEFSAVRTQLAVVLNNQSSAQTQSASTQAQLATFLSNQAASQAHSAMVLAKLDHVIARLDEVVRTVDLLKTDHTAVKAKTETSFSLLRWAGVTSFGILLTVFFAAFSVVRSAAHLESKVDHHEKILNEIKNELGEIRKPK